MCACLGLILLQLSPTHPQFFFLSFGSLQKLQIHVSIPCNGRPKTYAQMCVCVCVCVRACLGFIPLKLSPTHPLSSFFLLVPYKSFKPMLSHYLCVVPRKVETSILYNRTFQNKQQLYIEVEAMVSLLRTPYCDNMSLKKGSMDS